MSRAGSPVLGLVFERNRSVQCILKSPFPLWWRKGHCSPSALLNLDLSLSNVHCFKDRLDR